METRELFERLVADEPPMQVGVRDVVASGQRARRGRYAGAGAAVVAAVVVVTGAVIATQKQSESVPPGGVSPSPSASAAAVPSFAFGAAAQITASNARVYGLLTAYAGGASQVTKGD